MTFSLDDPDARFRSVALLQEVRRPRNGPPLARTGTTWAVDFPRPDADRMEYQFHTVTEEGADETTCDPVNPRRAPGPFGDKSVVEFPGYREPPWVHEDAPQGTTIPLDIKSRTLKDTLAAQLWMSEGADADEALPLLVAHDGPEYDRYSMLTRYLAVKVKKGDLPPLRAALLPPVRRDHAYSASAAYARALAYEILPAVETAAPAPHGRTSRVGMGASLGALAMLHVHRSHPATFGGLFLQSGSYFRQRFDKQESGFVRFGRIARFVGTILRRSEWTHPVPVALACGTAEENLANNRAVHEALVRQGYEAEFHAFRDAHNWVAWRDSFEPGLGKLLQKLWT